MGRRGKLLYGDVRRAAIANAKDKPGFERSFKCAREGKLRKVCDVVHSFRWGGSKEGGAYWSSYFMSCLDDYYYLYTTKIYKRSKPELIYGKQKNMIRRLRTKKFKQ